MLVTRVTFSVQIFIYVLLGNGKGFHNSLILLAKGIICVDVASKEVQLTMFSIVQSFCELILN